MGKVKSYKGFVEKNGDNVARCRQPDPVFEASTWRIRDRGAGLAMYVKVNRLT